MGDIEGKVTRVGASEHGQRASFNKEKLIRNAGKQEKLEVRGVSSHDNAFHLQHLKSNIEHQIRHGTD